jgi:hypothetical protein
MVTGIFGLSLEMGEQCRGHWADKYLGKWCFEMKAWKRWETVWEDGWIASQERGGKGYSLCS